MRSSSKQKETKPQLCVKARRVSGAGFPRARPPMHSAEAPSISLLWATGSRDAISRFQHHLEYYTELSFPLEPEFFKEPRHFLSSLWHLKVRLHRTRGSYTQALGDFVLFIRDRFLLCCFGCLELAALPYLPSVGIIGGDHCTWPGQQPRF